MVCKDEKDWIGKTKCDNNNFTKERIRDFKNYVVVSDNMGQELRKKDRATFF